MLILLILSSFCMLLVCGYPRCSDEPKCWIDSLAQDSQCHMESKCNGEICQQVCSRLTAENVKIEFITKALQFQRQLQMDFPVLEAQMIGTHNSFISNAYGIGLEESYFTEVFANSTLYNRYPRTVIANQRLSVRQQLELGVRHLEVDMARTAAVSGPDIKVCHWPIPPPNFLFYLRRAGLKSVRKRGPVQFVQQCIAASSCMTMSDEEIEESEESSFEDVNGKHWDKMWLGCNRNSLKLCQALAEIHDFITDRNHDDFIILYLDNRVSSSSYKQFVDILETSTLRVFTPKDLQEKYAGQYPSTRTLVNDGYNVMLEIYDKRKQWLKNVPESRDLIFDRNSHWNEFSLRDGWDPSNCRVKGSYVKQGTWRALDTSLSLGPSRLFNTSEPGIDGNDLESLIKCGIQRVALDQLTPSYLMNAVWAFTANSKLFKNPAIIDNLIRRIPRLGEPNTILNNENDYCLVFDVRTDKMELSSCVGDALPSLCRQKADLKTLELSTNLCDSSKNCSCHDGYSLDLPRTPVEVDFTVKLLADSKHQKMWIF